MNQQQAYEQIQNYLIENFNVVHGFSIRNIRRYVTDNNLRQRVNNEELNSAVNTAIRQVGPYYGRRIPIRKR